MCLCVCVGVCVCVCERARERKRKGGVAMTQSRGDVTSKMAADHDSWNQGLKTLKMAD